MPQPSPKQQIQQLLDKMSLLQSVSRFATLYYQAMTARLYPQTDPKVQKLQHIFLRYLKYELQFHERLKVLSEADAIDVADMVSVVDKRSIGLEDIIDKLQWLETGDDRHAASSHLLLAECYYQLEQFSRVSWHLEKAVQLEADDPIFHFALGYNRYLLAERAFTGVDDDTGEITVIDGRNYRSTLLDAVAAFEEGLTGGELDADLYWWIGTCLERAGFKNASEHAFEQAEELAETQGLALEQEVDSRPLARDTHNEKLPQITLAEIRRAGEQLKGSFTVSDILGKDDD